MTTEKDRIDELEHQLLTVQRRLDEAESRAKTAQAAAEQAAIEKRFLLAAASTGVVSITSQDLERVNGLVSMAKREGAWKLDERSGDLVMHVDGMPVANTAGGSAYMTPVAWLKCAENRAPWFFNGAAQAAKKTRNGAANPWSRENWNVTLQGRVLQMSVDEARRLAAEAGSRIDATQPPPASPPPSK